MQVIDSFDGDYRFLSNFSDHPVIVWGRIWKTAEHAFQAAKTGDPADKDWIALQPTPGKAKRAGSRKGLNGRKITLMHGWDDIKVDIMKIIVSKKFQQHPALRIKLIKTDGAELIEGNWWGDKWWGVDSNTGEGENWLGRILMEIRNELQQKDGPRG